MRKKEKERERERERESWVEAIASQAIAYSEEEGEEAWVNSMARAKFDSLSNSIWFSTIPSVCLSVCSSVCWPFSKAV